MKALRVFFATLLISVMMVTTVFAGGWHSDSNARWGYMNDDGSYLKDGWFWVNGRSYCFDTQGYMYSSCVTPDGYTVDDTGAWVVDGVVQERPVELSVPTLTVKVPNGYIYEADEKSIGFKSNQGAGVYIASELIEGLNDFTLLYGVDGSNALLSLDFIASLDMPYTIDSTDYVDYPCGSWYHTHFTITDTDGVGYPCDSYISAVGETLRLVLFVKDNVEFTPDQFMTYYIR